MLMRTSANIMHFIALSGSHKILLAVSCVSIEKAGFGEGTAWGKKARAILEGGIKATFSCSPHTGHPRDTQGCSGRARTRLVTGLRGSAGHQTPSGRVITVSVSQGSGPVEGLAL